MWLRYFDADGDGVVSPAEFSDAIKALSKMAKEDGLIGLQVTDAVSAMCTILQLALLSSSVVPVRP